MSTRTEASKDASGAMSLRLPNLLDGPAADALANAGEAFAHCCAECQREVMDFVSARTTADLTLVTSLSQCHDLLDVAKVQQAWAADATQAYLNEGSRLAGIGSDALREGMTSWFAALRASAQPLMHQQRA